jgi:hypothetical protein
MRDFTQDDIKDKELLEKLIQEETKRIFESDKARHGRNEDQITASVKQGKIAELYLVQSGRFKFADIKWHDLVNSAGEYVEVKAYDVNDWNAPSVIRDLQRYRTEKWCKAKYYYLFQCRGGTYKFLAILRIK